MNNNVGFVLGGGSVKGAYQIGAVCALLEKGIIPSYIYGISVGGLNGALLVNYYQKLKIQHPNLSDKLLGKLLSKKLREFWFTHVNSPKSIIKKKRFQLITSIITNNFNGVYSTSPLKKLIDKNIDFKLIEECPIKLQVGVTSLKTGQIKYLSPINSSDLLATSAIPILMEKHLVRGDICQDGGIVDNVPLKPAITENMIDKLYVIVTHPSNSSYDESKLGNLQYYIETLQEMIVRNTLEDDIREINRINEEVLRGENSSKKYVDYSLIRPESTLDISLSNFTQEDIIRLFEKGYYSIQ